MHKDKAIEITKDLFEHYPSVDEFYVTKDGQAFTQKDFAQNHAASLDKQNPTYETVTRTDEVEDAIAPTDTEVEVPEETATEATATEEEVVEVPAVKAAPVKTEKAKPGK
jgi:hypothetical protein